MSGNMRDTIDGINEKAWERAMKRPIPTNPYAALKAAGVPLDSHESDLYAKVTPASTAIIKASGWSYSTFISQIDGLRWYDLPFAYLPFWERKAGRP